MIAIKDFKMPENCIKCPMQFGGWCYVSPPDVDERVAPTVDDAVEQGKPDWCPLVDVPDEAGNCSEIPNNSDCVSRQAVLDALEGEITVTGWKNAVAVKRYADLALDRIKRLPFVRPERKKGVWKTIAFLTSECSECHEQIHELEFGNFCPCCGADMRGEKND